MKIAFVVSDLSIPAAEGLHQQSLLTIEGLRNAGHVVDVFGYVRRQAGAVGDDKVAGFFRLQPIRSRLPALLIGIRNILIPKFLLSHEERALALAISDASYDVVHLEGAAAAGFSTSKLAHRTVIGLIDPQSRRRWRQSKSGSLTRRAANLLLAASSFVFEMLVSKNAAALHVVSIEDQKYLASRRLGATILWVPIFLPPEIENYNTQMVHDHGAPFRVVIFADLRQEHMRRAFDEILEVTVPALQESEGKTPEIDVLCRKIPDQITESRAKALGVSMTAWVNDYRAHLCDADVIVIPDLMGTGLKNRTIQAMGLGKCVVGTKVAFEGIPAEPGKEAIIYQDAQALASWLLRLQDDLKLKDSLAKAGKIFVTSNFSSAKVIQRWQDIYNALSCGEISTYDLGQPEPYETRAATFQET